MAQGLLKIIKAPITVRGRAHCECSDEVGRAACSRSGAASIAVSTALGHATRLWWVSRKLSSPNLSGCEALRGVREASIFCRFPVVRVFQKILGLRHLNYEGLLVVLSCFLPTFKRGASDNY